MPNIRKASFAVALAALPVFAGALTLQISNPAANAEAKAKNAAALVQVLACHSPEKTIVTAAAIGSNSQVIPLKVFPLSVPGLYAVIREWPQTGSWVIKFVAANPDYKNYATGALVPYKDSNVEWSQAKSYFHEPNAQDVNGLLK